MNKNTPKLNDNQFFNIKGKGKAGLNEVVKMEGSRLWDARSPLLPDDQKKSYFTRLILNVSNNEKLQPLLQNRQGLFSIYNCMSQAIQLGLNIGGIRPQAQIIGFAGKAQLIPTSDGLRWAVISEPNPLFKDVISRIIYENEEFSIDFAAGEVIHNYDGKKERGQWRGVFTKLVNFDGSSEVFYMSRKEVEKIRDSYSKSYGAFKAGKTKSSPWQDSPEEMAKKTHQKQVLKPYVSQKEALSAMYEMENDAAINQDDYNSQSVDDRMGARMDNINNEKETIIQAEPEPKKNDPDPLPSIKKTKQDLF